MKRKLLDTLICPACLPQEFPLDIDSSGEDENEILEGVLKCPKCMRSFPIESGIAFLDPSCDIVPAENKYELDEVVSSYLWSHYADLFDDVQASNAYREWAEKMNSHSGIGIDLGGAVGRFAFEMSSKCDLAVGIDNSVAFIKTARTLMEKREITVHLKEEGHLTREVTIRLPAEWEYDRVDFIVADAERIPFRSNCIASFASLNLIDKVSRPLQHLKEMNRVVENDRAQFLLSDPFSWSEKATEEKEWLGGKRDGPFAGRGLENIINLLAEKKNGLPPTWDVEDRGHVWWKIRTHANHYELIRSCFVKASR